MRRKGKFRPRKNVGLRFDIRINSFTRKQIPGKRTLRSAGYFRYESQPGKYKPWHR